MTKFSVATFYCFARLTDYRDLKPLILTKGLSEGVKGTILLADEGINATIAGSSQAIANFLSYIKSDQRFSSILENVSETGVMPFKRLKVRLKKEIAAMGVSDIDPNQIVGTYVNPEVWNKIVEDPEFVLIDARNQYEIEIGTFFGAINPKIDKFRDLPKWLETNSEKLNGKKIAMFCTGGIRCEKSTAFLKGLGYKNVFHLKGGILKYLEVIRQENSKWIGDCFVFDERVSVRYGLEVGDFCLCYACGRPVSKEETLLKNYVPGVSCSRCYNNFTDTQKEKFLERQRQKELIIQRNLTRGRYKLSRVSESS